MSEKNDNDLNIFGEEQLPLDDQDKISEELVTDNNLISSATNEAKKTNNNILSKILENKVPIFIGFVGVFIFIYLFVLDTSTNTNKGVIYPSSSSQMQHLQQNNIASQVDPLGEIVVPELEEQMNNLKQKLVEKDKQLLIKHKEFELLQKNNETLVNEKKFLNHNLLEARAELDQLRLELKDTFLLKQSLDNCVAKQEDLIKAASNKTNKGVKASVFKINTIYSNQAWIQDANRTYVVTKGDFVRGLEIKEIDAKNRKIFTSNGVIQ